ncbi:tetratricopeptide repeat protein [Fulvivirgaceae bacterium BMA12]|uniref:Tetratricopeptide repeat protein n=1 Tax=Agaribacillus aureus TaxID=3051825 RepID=A0ABT8LBA4_9BACT|nr:tetratricopeptide repeat protein [Fulvivirgaceae bacterium BMA12]
MGDTVSVKNYSEQEEDMFRSDASSVLIDLKDFVFREEVNSDQIAKEHWGIVENKLLNLDFDGIGAALSNVLKYDKDKLRRAFAKGLVKLLVERKYSEAEKAFETAISIDPNYIPAYINLGIAKSRIEDYAGAVKVYEALIAIDPENEVAYHNLGIAFSNLEKYPEAVKAFEAAIALNKEDTDTYYFLILTKHQMKDFVGMQESYKAASAIDPEFHKGYFNLGFLKYYSDDFAAAIKVFETLIAIKPEFTKAYIYLGSAKIEIGDFADAAKVYETLLKIDPEYDKGYYNLGCAKLYLEDFTGAGDAFLAAIKSRSLHRSLVAREVANMFLQKKQGDEELKKKDITDFLENELVKKLIIGDEKFLEKLKGKLYGGLSKSDQKIFSLISKILDAKNREIQVLKDTVKQLQAKRKNNTKAAREKHKENYNTWVSELVEPMKEALKNAEIVRGNKPSTITLADYFNNVLKIKTREDAKFDPTTINRVLKRQKELGLIDPNNE